jgi:hypothetical protein
MVSMKGKTILCIFLGLSMLVISTILSPTLAQAERPEIERPVHSKAIPGGFIIYVDPTYEKGPIKKYLKNKGGKVAHDFKSIPAVAVKGLPETALEGLSHMPGVTRIWQDREVHAYLAESIPLINANGSGVDSAYGFGVNVCILDTGIDDNHSAFAFGTRVIAQKDFVNNDEDADDDHGHGTHVAGIAASQDIDFRGVARGANLIIGKVLNAVGGGYTSDIIAGIEWCDATGAQVINMSLGGGKFANACDTDPLAEASNIAVDNGVIVVAASGNDGWLDSMGSPACGSQVISVGGVYDSNWGWFKWGCLTPSCLVYACKDEPATYDTRFCASNGGPQLDVVAPGALITSAYPSDNEWEQMAGTSMAAPHVAGLAALILEQNPSLEPNQVRDLIRSNASIPSQHRCGDGYCAGESFGEDCYSCPRDCPRKSTGKPTNRWCCGNGEPENSEPIEICPVDYGTGEDFNHIYGYGRIDAKTTWEAALTYGQCSSDGECDDGDSCTNHSCVNEQCSYETITSCTDDDGCCPSNCTSANDNDCISSECSGFKEGCTTDGDCCPGLTCFQKKSYCK